MGAHGRRTPRRRGHRGGGILPATLVPPFGPRRLAVFGRRRSRERQPYHMGQHAAPGNSGGRSYSRRGRRLPGEQAIPSYTPTILARSIDGHLLRTGQDVYAWYRLAPQRWSFRSDSQRQDLIAAIAGQYAELQGRWLHLRVTARPYPIRMWAEAHVHHAVNRLPAPQS